MFYSKINSLNNRYININIMTQFLKRDNNSLIFYVNHIKLQYFTLLNNSNKDISFLKISNIKYRSNIFNLKKNN